MKTIEIIIGGHKAQFTTKSLTLGGMELLYANMSHVSHDAENHIFRFTYGGKKIALPYEEKDARILTAIFSQVQALEAKKLSLTQALSDVQAAAIKQGAATGANPQNTEAAVQSPVSKNADEISESVEKNEDESKDNKEEKPKKSRKGLFARKKKEESEGSSDDTSSEKTADESSSKEKEPMDPEKKSRLKKSLKMFAIVLAVIIALSAIYYFIFGTSQAPSDANPNNTESQQYDDIEQLIDDMQ